MKLDNPIPKPLALKGYAMRLAVTLCLFAFPAFAEIQCGDRAEIIKELGDRYGEARVAMALTAGQSVIEIFANPDTQTWTGLETSATGQTCIVVSGNAWEARNDPLPPNG